MVVDFKRWSCQPLPLIISGTAVVSSKFLGLQVHKTIKLEANTISIKKTQYRMFFLWQLIKFRQLQTLLVLYYCTQLSVSVLACLFAVWFGSYTSQIYFLKGQPLMITAHCQGNRVDTNTLLLNNKTVWNNKYTVPDSLLSSYNPHPSPYLKDYIDPNNKLHHYINYISLKSS